MISIGQVLTPAQMGSKTRVTSDNTSNVDAASLMGVIEFVERPELVRNTNCVQIRDLNECSQRVKT